MLLQERTQLKSGAQTALPTHLKSPPWAIGIGRFRAECVCEECNESVLADLVFDQGFDHLVQPLTATPVMGFYKT